MSRRRRRRRTGRRRRRRRALGALQRADVQRLRAAPPQGVRWQVKRTRLSPGERSGIAGGRANRTASIPMRFNARRGEAKTPRAGAREGLSRASRRGACGARRAAPGISAGGSQVWTAFHSIFHDGHGDSAGNICARGQIYKFKRSIPPILPQSRASGNLCSFRDQALWGRPPQGD